MSHPPVSDLQHVPLFKTLTAAQLEDLARHMQATPFVTGDVLAHEGDAGYAFYLLGEGAATVSVADREVGWLYRYDFFGELALLTDGHRHATVTALESGVAWSVSRRVFRDLERDHAEIASAIRDTAEDRQQTDARLLVR